MLEQNRLKTTGLYSKSAKQLIRATKISVTYILTMESIGYIVWRFAVFLLKINITENINM